MLGMVGFQTRMTQDCQRTMIRSLPGFEKAVILRFGSIHRNLYLNLPEICDRYLADRKRKGLFYAGQICGVEGYVESIASAIVVAWSIFAALQDRSLPAIPGNTMIGALMNYVHTPNTDFQPMNANMGLIPFAGRRRGGRRARNRGITAAAVAAMEAYRSANAWLF
jgi:methylenetetrahydrofolate--tRNA-(uracil-5-)-methyltransferase